MKYILNVLWAPIFTFCLLCAVKELAVSDTAIKYTHWIFRINFWHQAFFWWAVFSFPHSFGQILSLIANTLMRGVGYVTQGAGQIVEHTWKYRAGKIALGAGVAYFLYTYIF